MLAYFSSPAPATAPPKRSTAASNTSDAVPSASGASLTTSLARYSKPEDSDPNYTLDCEKPTKVHLVRNDIVHFYPGPITSKELDTLASVIHALRPITEAPVMT